MKNKNPNKLIEENVLPETQKKYVLDHVLYEFEMYFISFNYLTNHNIKLKQGFINAFFISHRTHIRNIYDFFKDCKKFDDDIICHDIIKQDIILTNNEEEKKLLETAKENINKANSHLSFTRVVEYKTLEKKGIPNDKLFSIITKAIYEFIKTLLKNKKYVYDGKLEFETKGINELEIPSIKDRVTRLNRFLDDVVTNNYYLSIFNNL